MTKSFNSGKCMPVFKDAHTHTHTLERWDDVMSHHRDAFVFASSRGRSICLVISLFQMCKEFRVRYQHQMVHLNLYRTRAMRGWGVGEWGSGGWQGAPGDTK